MTKLLREISKGFLRYGDIKYDITTVENYGYRRIRVIRLNNKIYLHHMYNGEVIEIKEV